MRSSSSQRSTRSRSLQTGRHIYKKVGCWLLAFGCATARLVAQQTIDPKGAGALVDQAVAAADSGQNADAIRLATEAIEKEPALATAYKIRGRELFRAGRIQESVSDFDKYVELEPKLAPRQWERGIALYYAEDFDRGSAQFEQYQTFDGHDVENSVWRFLCMAPKSGVEKAQAVMLPIELDRRVPMMEVYNLFRGKSTPDAVLAAAKKAPPSEAALAGRLFYAHLYLGLWFDADGKTEEAKRLIDLAAHESLGNNPHLNRYMWDVARIHQKKLRGELKPRK